MCVVRVGVCTALTRRTVGPDDRPGFSCRSSPLYRSSRARRTTTRVTLAWADRQLLLRTAEPPEGAVRVGFKPEDAHVIHVGK